MFLVIGLYGADNLHYKDAYIKTVVQADEDGNPIFNLPFNIYHQTIVENNINHYCYLTKDLIGKEVIVLVHVKIGENISGYEGYIGDTWEDVRKSVDFKKHWTITKEQALTTTDEKGEVKPYLGLDKDELVPIYAGIDK